MKKLTPRDKYLQKKYGITEEEYDDQLERQGGGCLICGSTPKSRPLHVDHDHAVERWKICSEKIGHRVWKAWPAPCGSRTSRLNFSEQAETKPLARAKVKARLKRMSVRALLCFPCNTGLRVFLENTRKLHAAAYYLDEYNAWMNGSKSGKGFLLDG